MLNRTIIQGWFLVKLCDETGPNNQVLWGIVKGDPSCDGVRETITVLHLL